MSEPVHYKGKIKEIPNEFDTIKDKKLQLLDRAGHKNIPDQVDIINDRFTDVFWNEKFEIEGKLYEVIEKTDVEYSDDIYNAKLNKDRTIDFEVKYHNGSCCFETAIADSLKNIIK